MHSKFGGEASWETVTLTPKKEMGYGGGVNLRQIISR
jgi:hypothetical protein